MVRLILNKIENPKETLEVKINLNDTPTTKKWISNLKNALQNNLPIKKHLISEKNYLNSKILKFYFQHKEMKFL